MQTTQLRDWQFTHSLPDQWFYQIARGPATGPVTLDELDDILAQKPRNDIRAHHASQESETPPWIEVAPAWQRHPDLCPECGSTCVHDYGFVHEPGMCWIDWVLLVLGAILTLSATGVIPIVGLLVVIYAVTSKVSKKVEIWQCVRCKHHHPRSTNPSAQHTSASAAHSQHA